MTLYAHFKCDVPDPSPVVGWFNTEAHDYVLPDPKELLEVSLEQWGRRMGDPSGWAVSAGVLVSWRPVVPLPQQAHDLLEQKIALGVDVTSVSNPGINGRYAIHPMAMAHVYQTGAFATSFESFPSGEEAHPLTDVDGVPHFFTLPTFIMFWRLAAVLVHKMQAQETVMAKGGDPIWPDQKIELK